MEVFDILICDRALLSALFGAVISVATFSTATPQANPDFPVIIVDAHPSVVEALPRDWSCR